jgi:flagellar biosynthesis/type III secretory pathway protein FliH
MRENRKRDESRSGESIGQPETEESMILWMEAYDTGYEVGYEEGMEEASRQFAQTHLLLMNTGGNA